MVVWRGWEVYIKRSVSVRSLIILMNINKKEGFTLIEILIVVAIIAILASVVLIGLGPTQQSGRDARRISDLREIQTGLELYYSKCGFYPGAANCAGGWVAATFGQMSAALTGSGIGVAVVPNDPTNGATYYYAAAAGDGTVVAGSTYVLSATLENSNNSVFSGASYGGAGLTNPKGGGATCAAPNYCVTL